MELRDAAEAATILVLAIVGLATVLIVNTGLAAERCRYCEHCKEKDRLAREKLAQERHAEFHRWHGGTAWACKDPACRGR